MFGKIRELNQAASDWERRQIIKQALAAGLAVGMAGAYQPCPYPPNLQSWGTQQQMETAIDNLTEAQVSSYASALLVFAGDLQDPG